jgi:hypothetical protein
MGNMCAEGGSPSRGDRTRISMTIVNQFSPRTRLWDKWQSTPPPFRIWKDIIRGGGEATHVQGIRCRKGT